MTGPGGGFTFSSMRLSVQTVNRVYSLITSWAWTSLIQGRLRTTMEVPSCSLPLASDRPCDALGSAINIDSTPPWWMLGSASDDFRMGGCSDCAQIRDRPFPPSAARSASPAKGRARSYRSYATVAT
jgi:hypothetical protein